MELRQILETGTVLTSIVSIYTTLYISAVSEFDLYILGYLVCAYLIVFLHQISPLLVNKDRGREHSSVYRSDRHSGIWTGILLPLALTLNKQSDVDIDVLSQHCILFTIVIVLVIYNPTNQSQIIGACMLLWFRGYFIKAGSFGLIVCGIFCLMFYLLLIRIPAAFRRCFTEGEAAVDTQILSLVLLKISLYAFENANKSEKLWGESNSIAVIAFEAVFISTLLLCMSSVQTRPLQFYLIYCAVGLTIIVPLCLYLLGPNPVIIFYRFLMKSSSRRYLLTFWTFLSVISIAIVYFYNNDSHQSRAVTTRTRKYFHLIVVLVYIPGLYFDPELLYTASVIALGILIIVETVRLYKVPPFGEKIDEMYQVFVDNQDQGSIILTPIYLLVGMSLPLWVTSSTLTDSPLKLYSGVLSVGIGDTAASVFGSLLGKYRWPGCKKTVEGTIASVLLQIVTLSILQQMGVPAASLSFINILAVVLTSLIEAFTEQIDNLILPLYMFCLLSLNS